jgi:hypothetical protein
MRPVIASLLLIALLPVAPARAAEDETSFTLAPMYGVTSGPSKAGMGASLHLAYGVTDQFNVRCTALFDNQYVVTARDWSSFAAFQLGAGTNLELGEGQVIPYVYGDVGMAYVEGTHPPMALDLSGELGFDWLLSSRLAAGLAARASVFVGDLELGDAFLFNALFRFTVTF